MRSLPSTWPRYSLDPAERVEVALAGLRIVGRHRAARDRSTDLQDSTAEADPTADPGVLLVGPATLELDEHPEPARVDGTDAEDRTERIKGAVQHERRRVLRARAADPIAADDPYGTPRRRRRAPPPTDLGDVTDRGPAVDVGLDRLPRVIVSATTVPSGKVRRSSVAWDRSTPRPGPARPRSAGRPGGRRRR